MIIFLLYLKEIKHICPVSISCNNVLSTKSCIGGNNGRQKDCILQRSNRIMIIAFTGKHLSLLNLSGTQLVIN